MQTALPVSSFWWWRMILLVLLVACQHSKEGNNGKNASLGAVSGQVQEPKSFIRFADAEKKLAIGAYSFAAAQLHTGILAYRIETGKFNGHKASQANRAIDVLIRLHKNLKEGKAVNPTDLHIAIQNALSVEGFSIQEAGAHAEDNKGLIVPVSGQ